MINHEHFCPTSDFDLFFKFFAGITYEQAIELSKLENEIGEFNRNRILYVAKMWWRLLEIRHAN